jgi:small-conductance mechanosensitive channel
MGPSDLMHPLLAQIARDPFHLLVPLAYLTGTLVAGFIVRRVVFRASRTWAARTNSHLDVLIEESLRGALLIWALILGLHLANENSNLPVRYQRQIHTFLEFLWVLSLTIAASRFAGNVVRFYGGRVTGAQSVTSLTQKLAQLIVLAVGTVWLLKVVFDMSLTPVITTLGVGGLAVALALQDTLSNLFAGFYVSISRLVRIGDYIKLSSGEEGYVTDINWRCTTMLTLANNMVVIPNSKLGTTIYTNYYLPEPSMELSVSFGVAGDNDIDRVEAILLEESKAAAGHIEGMLADPAPNIRFSPGPGDSGLAFQVNFHVSTFADQHRVMSELRKRLYKRLVKEKIGMAVPTRTIIVESKSPAA